jgi:DNA-binding transcriptional ArsR family regulator
MAMQNGLKSSLCSKYLKALADPDRLLIIECLRGGPRPVSDISRELGAPFANVSYHLKQLQRAGLVLAKRQGRLQIYSLPPQILREDARTSLQVLDLGCCRLELKPREDAPVAATNGKSVARPRRRASASRPSQTSG